MGAARAAGATAEAMEVAEMVEDSEAVARVVEMEVAVTAVAMGVATGEAMVEERAAARAGAVTVAVTAVVMGVVTAGADTVTVRTSTGLQERRAGTYSLEDDGGAAALPIERVQTSLRTE